MIHNFRSIEQRLEPGTALPVYTLSDSGRTLVTTLEYQEILIHAAAGRVVGRGSYTRIRSLEALKPLDEPVEPMPEETALNGPTSDASRLIKRADGCRQTWQHKGGCRYWNKPVERKPA